MLQYQILLSKILSHGEPRQTRRGPTLALFGERLEFDLRLGFPAITCKQLNFKSVAAELEGFLRGEQDASRYNTGIWLADALRWWKAPNSQSRSPTDMGRVYGVQWRDWWPSRLNGLESIDQLRQVVDGLKTNPQERYHVVIAWNPGERELMCLEPCHYAFQFFVSKGKYLDCMFHMRSVDTFLGLPFDIASYALLMSIIANEVGLTPRRLVATLGDTHIYRNHSKQTRLILKREPYPLPRLELKLTSNIDHFRWTDARLLNYKHHDPVKAIFNNEQ